MFIELVELQFKSDAKEDIWSSLLLHLPVRCCYKEQINHPRCPLTDTVGAEIINKSFDEWILISHKFQTCTYFSFLDVRKALLCFCCKLIILGNHQISRQC